MAEHPVIMNGDGKKQVKIMIRQPGSGKSGYQQAPVIEENELPAVAEPKESFKQKLSKYAFGEEVAEPGKYVWKSYLEPTGKRVANDIVEHFLLMIKHTFQRWIWNGKTLDNGNWVGDRTSFSNFSKGNEPIKAMVAGSPVKELIFPTEAAANKVLKNLNDTISEEKLVTVRQYYEASGQAELCEPNGVSSSSGWTSLAKAKVEATPDGSGYQIVLPRPVSLSSGK